MGSMGFAMGDDSPFPLVKSIFDAWTAGDHSYLRETAASYQFKLAGSEGSLTSRRAKLGPPALLSLLQDDAAASAAPAAPAAEHRILEQLRAHAPQLHWFSTRGTDASCVVVGPSANAPLAASNMLLGFLYLGPHSSYPAHAHASTGAFHVVAGRCVTLRAGGRPVARAAGDCVVRAAGEVQSLETADSAVLICWVNSGELVGQHHFVGDESAGRSARSKL
jgi:hypothetical protein